MIFYSIGIHFIGQELDYHTGKERVIYSKGFNCEHSGQI